MAQSVPLSFVPLDVFAGLMRSRYISAERRPRKYICYVEHAP
jgi:hypothetical protein